MPLRSVEDEQGVTYCENMDDLLKESDFVVLAVNLTPETTGLISHRQLALMKPTATLVNISRGEENVTPLILVEDLQRLQLSYSETLIFDFFSCLRSGCGPGRFSRSSAVWIDSCGSVRRDSPRTFTKVSPHPSTTLTITSHTPVPTSLKHVAASHS